MTDKISHGQSSPLSHLTRAERLFSTIAPIYDLILGRTLTCLYRKAIAHAIKLIPSLNPNDKGTPGSQESLNMTALDVGTGTGLLAAVLAERGFTVFGIDVSANMLRTARRRRPHAAKFARAPAHCSSMQPGAPFDLVCAAMLMHGLPRHYRQCVLTDMAKAAKHAVMIVDYSLPYRLLTAIVESLEQSFYRKFLQEFPDDLSLCYGHTNILSHPLNGSCSLYIVRP